VILPLWGQCYDSVSDVLNGSKSSTPKTWRGIDIHHFGDDHDLNILQNTEQCFFIVLEEIWDK
jgi:hypothetical protein